MLVYKIMTTLLVIIGVLGIFLPVLPSTPVIFLGALVYSFSTGFTVFGLRDLIIMGGLVILAEGMQYFFSMIGAKKFGASKFGVVGGMIGLVVGLFTLGPIGLLVGPFAGAIISELIRGRVFNEAVRVGIGSLFGVLGGTLMTLIIALAMAGWIFWTIF